MCFLNKRFFPGHLLLRGGSHATYSRYGLVAILVYFATTILGCKTSSQLVLYQPFEDRYLADSVVAYNIESNRVVSNTIFNSYGDIEVDGDIPALVATLDGGVKVYVVATGGQVSLRLFRYKQAFGPTLKRIGKGEGIAYLAATTSGIGVINTNSGHWIVKPGEYAAIGFPAENRIIVATESGDVHALDFDGDTVFTLDSERVKVGNILPVFNDGHIGFTDFTTVFILDKSGQLVSEFPGDSVSPSENGLFRIHSELTDTFGFIKSDGTWLVRPKYRSAGIFNEGYAAVSLESTLRAGYWGGFSTSVFPAFPIRDERGQIRYGDNIEPPSHRWGYIDHTGSLAIELMFDEVKRFQEGFAAARIGSYWGYIDHKGKWTIPPKFLDAFNFSNGIAQVMILEDGIMSYLLIDQQGFVVWNDW